MELALQEARERSGLSHEDVARRMYDLLGRRYAPSGQTVLRYHTPGRGPRRPDVVLLQAFCRIYDLDVATIAPELVDDVERVRRLFTPGEISTDCYPRAIALRAAA